jgi:chemotaxis protein methyltransferase CheR
MTGPELTSSKVEHRVGKGLSLSLHILVISDNGSFAAYLCELLAAAGHAALSVPEGKEAIRTIRLEKPDLIIVAVEAAKVAGLAIEQRLHTPAGPRTVPVIVISECLRLESELLYVFDFIPKPLDVNRLLDDVAALAQKPAKTASPAALSDRQYQEFSSHIHSETGLHFESRNRSALERGLGKRMSALRIESCTEYLAYLKRHGENRHELQKLLQFLTVGETYFFRYPSHFDALRERLSGKRADPAEPIRIWSAGCSTGEEPYSIAISVMEALPDWRDRDIKIIATDINNRSIKRARDGVYSPWSMRMTDQRHLKRYFDRNGESFLIREEVKRLVEFSHLNLSSPSIGEICLDLKGLDAIFCRNVLIYFSPESVASMVQNFASALKASGQLFLGHAETLFQRCTDLEIRRRENSFYYVRTGPWQAAVHPSVPEQKQAPLLRALPPPAKQAANPSARLEAAQQLFDAEDFDASYELLETLLSESPEETGALILKGFILAGRGRLQEALDTCRRVIDLNDLLPGAYFLKGVVFDASDRLAEAADEYRKALLLDHDFIMPRYHMGRLLLRLGRVPDAAREIRNSIRILAKRGDEGTVPYSGGLTLAVCMVQLQNALAQVA